MSATSVARDPIRGSSLLLIGRLLTLSVSYIAQVLAIRYLSKTDYGAWTYALSAVTVLQSIAALGLDRAITRFVPIYREHNDYQRLIGVVLLVVTAALGTSAILIAAVHIFPETVARLTGVASKSLTLLGVLVFVVPLEALDTLLVGLFACLGQTRAIFFRRHVLGPAIRLAVTVGLVLWSADVTFLAYGYLIGSAVGLLINARFFVRALGLGGLREQLSGTRVTWPTREVFAFTLPLLTADVAGAFIQSAGALALGTLHDLDKVAVFTAAVPLAALNQVVMRNFTLLYTPAASRLFARGDYASINELYWRTAVWMAILTLPIFAVTFATARSLTLLLYGTRYEEAGTVLALLSVGEYVNAALGFNGLTLRVLNKVRYVVTINFLAAIVALVANLVLVPRYGAIGAAVATSVTMILHNIFKQAGLRLAAGISLFDVRYSGLYAAIALCAGLLVLTQWLVPGRPAVLVGLACAVSFVTLMYSRRLLMVSEMFPEILKVPILRAILA